jgi:hypothetical protein
MAEGDSLLAGSYLRPGGSRVRPDERQLRPVGCGPCQKAEPRVDILHSNTSMTLI